jgi:catechol 2,3-dioxygenase-like lactoylglutathione lyase family enzyme
MADLRIDHVNVIVPELLGASSFLRALGVGVDEPADGWEEWAAHHQGLPTVANGFVVDLDSSAFASNWGGMAADFAGVVVNVRADSRAAVDAVFDRALALGAEVLRAPSDAFWGARFAVVRGPGPIVLGMMSAIDPAWQSAPPAIADFA